MKTFLASVSLVLCAALASAADFDWKTRFPEGLVDANGKSVDLATLKNKTKLAVVFVSSDKDEAQMFAYMKETKMPWPAVPFRSAGGGAIQNEQGVSGIPTLLVFGKNGELLTKNGRDLDALKKLLGK